MELETKTENYTKKDLEDSLRRAFVDKKANFIRFDGHTARNKFLSSAIQHGLDQDLLYFARETGDSQWTEHHYKLSQKGKKYFGIE